MIHRLVQGQVSGVANKHTPSSGPINPEEYVFSTVFQSNIFLNQRRFDEAIKST